MRERERENEGGRRSDGCNLSAGLINLRPAIGLKIQRKRCRRRKTLSMTLACASAPERLRLFNFY